ncbi:type IX secretion system sortase PorU [Flavobacterium microcysteis]|uniref:Type IX secretion system sortase PorU n=1 Tax=Flavobacterium microcysteis TaxID=2596891 RepID=A0A501QCX8_9FLAO|nr:type IX secretion system sortase PorU [Flavobacterium microcysteis]TPD70017.1 type IX secretion system sortase PorU [Flavobacterium microcysteis]
MKKITLLLLLISSYVSFAQQRDNISIEWIDNSGIYSEQIQIKAPIFKSSGFYFNYEKKAVFFNLKIPVSGFADENSLQITNIVYETISREQLGDLRISSIPSSIEASLKNMSNPASQKAVLYLSPIIKSGNTFQRVKSFTYSFSTTARRSGNTIQNSSLVYNSVLSSGEWYRFYVVKSGVYKISRSFLQSLGMNVGAANARNIKIYGNGGRMLPLLNGAYYPEDLIENAITLVGESDGSFDSQDYILFYAEGMDNWNKESETHNNLYADRAYYYVTAQGGPGKRIGNMPAIADNPTLNMTTFDDYQYHELDKTNIGRLGRKWFGERFNIDNEQTFDFKFPNIATGTQIKIRVNAAASAFTPTTMNVSANSQDINPLTFAATTSDGDVASERSTAGNFPAAESVAIKLNYNNGGVPSADAYLDYIILEAKRNLQGYGKQFRFRYNDADLNTGVIQYQLSSASRITQVWDITDIYNVQKVENNGADAFSFKAYMGEDRNYIAVDAADYYSPLKDSRTRVVNQNLKGTILKNAQGAFQDLDYLIVTPAFLSSQAERLANFHRTYSQLNVKVVNLETIYEEFSSGKQDIGAIRNFVKYIYNNASIPSKRLKYLNLFGDASFDYKNRISNNTNIVPVFQALTSFSLAGSIMSDDYFTMLDNDEGLMIDTSAQDMELAVGRMLVSDIKQAEEMVTKVIEYHAIESYGKWRNNFVLISDDVDVAWENSIQTGIDALGDQIAAQKPFVNVEKIHTDSYVQEASAGGFRYPKARKDFVDAINQGALVFNYFGHGGEDGLAKERIFEKADAQSLNNRYKYPLFVTVTCEFTRFDNPYRPTAGEYTYWNPKGGAIAMVTTTRQIDVVTGQAINQAFSSELYGYGTTNHVPISEALRVAKNNYTNGSALMVSYVGDPAIRLAIPKPTIVLTKINDQPVAASTFVFNALSPVKLTGEVRNVDGNTILSNYNGSLSVNLFDKNVQRSTFGNDGVTDGNGNLIIMNFTLLGETIFRGNASVANGQFEFNFVVPRDISIPVGNGRISFYAKRNQGLEDQTGYNTDIKVGGINPNATADNIGPRVRLYMNDETFISGGITNESPIFLAFLEDENGINTASGIGHDIVAILDGDENNPYILNDYYETELDNHTKGKVRFPFRNLAVGLHTITFKAWDVYNNPVTSEIQFIVVGDETVTLKNVLNYPNPFVSYTQFWFTHNRPYEPLEVQVQIITITGKIVKTINQMVTTEGFLSREISWDGKDDFGDKIGKGVYVYKLTVKSTLTNKKTEKYEKLVIL